MYTVQYKKMTFSTSTNMRERKRGKKVGKHEGAKRKEEEAKKKKERGSEGMC